MSGYVTANLVDANNNPLGTAGNPLNTTGASGGGGGPVTIADGADSAQGAKADTAYTGGAGAFSVIAILKGIYAAAVAAATPATQAVTGTFFQAKQPVSIASGDDASTGAVGDAAYTGSGNSSVIAGLKGLYTNFSRILADSAGSWVHAPPSTPSFALSGSITTSGSTVAITFINTARQEILNPSTATLWASWGTPQVNGAGAFPIAPGGSYSQDRVAGTLTLLSTAASQTYTVNRFS